MKNLKSKMMMPAFAIVFAIASAFATNATDQDLAAPVQGYIQNGPQCIESIDCSTTGNEICTVGTNTQVFGMNLSGTVCDKVLYKL